jgi:hypothetical protein
MAYLPNRRQKSSEAEPPARHSTTFAAVTIFAPLDQALRRDTARRCAGAARPDLAAVADEGSHYIAQRLESFLVDLVRVAPRGEPDALDSQQNHDILIGGGGHITDDKGQRRALWIFATMGAVNKQLRHVNLLPFDPI